MITIQKEAKIRLMTLEDRDSVFLIDHKIRQSGNAITYAKKTTECNFLIDHSVGPLAKPHYNVDLFHGDVLQLLWFGQVVEVEGCVRGFILGGQAHIGEVVTGVGEILILGVHPDYERRGIATALVNGLCDKFHTHGIKHVRIEVEQYDKGLLGFVKRIGFAVEHGICHLKSL